MKKRTDRRAVQLDRFASVPPPPRETQPPAPVVQAAAEVERAVRKKRSEAGSISRLARSYANEMERESVPFAAGHGYRAVLYGGAEYRGGRVCFACRRAIAP